MGSERMLAAAALDLDVRLVQRPEAESMEGAASLLGIAPAPPLPTAVAAGSDPLSEGSATVLLPVPGEGTMSVPNRRPSAAASTTGAAALVAADGAHPDRPCVQGELVWTSELCGDLPCQCEWAFNGAASDQATTLAEVRRMPGVGRAFIRDALVAAMTADVCCTDPALAGRRADELLALAARLPEGTLLRLEHGVPVPFPQGSRVVARGHVVSPARRGRR